MAACSSSSTSRWNYDVFLSFRGEDVRKNFLGHLYSALHQVGFRTYKDDQELERGFEISPALQEAIEQSRISLVVFSKNYADSRWCLNELVNILDCREKFGQIVLPVFFHVDPSDVRNLEGSFGEGFLRLRHNKVVSIEKVEEWKKALNDVANLAGFHLDAGNWDEVELIKKIIEDIWVKMHPTYLSDIDQLFGVESQVGDVMSLLKLDSDDIRFIGIYGMPGVGKTTLAKVIRNHLFPRFESNSLLEDVQLASKQRDGLIDLQKRLLCDILKLRELNVSNIDDGIYKIKSRLRHKRVLVILDNVDHLDELAALAKEHNWFGTGSRIIVTSRDEHLLTAHRVDAKYMVLPLPHEDASRLFCWHAFRQDHLVTAYAELANEVISYTGGLPLVLKVLGSFLSDKTIVEWRSALEEFRSTPHEEVFEKLRISFDSLNEHQKAIFLDIAFFFVGMDESDVIAILDGCGFHTRILLRVLIQKCLLTISDNKLRMHDLLREMGREIVCSEYTDEPGKRSRIWFYKDARKVLKYHEGSDKLRGLICDFPTFREKSFSTEAFASMKKLRLLQLGNVDFAGSCEYFSTELRWLCWDGFPWNSIPTNLNLKKVVMLELRYSKLEKIWKQTKALKNLKVLDLSHSLGLTNISDFSGLSNVEKLILEGCINLIEVHQSIGNLNKLISLNLKNCKSLGCLPTDICKLNLLEELNLYRCSNLKELPEDFGDMKSLKELNISSTAIKILPMSFERLKTLTKFVWDNEGSLSESPCINSFSPIWSLRSIKDLNLSFCNLSDESFPSDLGGVPNLENLLIRGNTFHSLPTCIWNLPKLEELNASECDLSGSVSPMVGATLPSLRYLHLSKNNFCSLPVDIGSLPIEFVDLDECKMLQTVELRENLLVSTKNCTALEKIGHNWVTNSSENFSEMESMFDRCTYGKDCSGCSKLGEIQGAFKLQPLKSGELQEVERLFKLDSLEDKEVNLRNDFTNTRMKGPIQALSERGIYSIFIPGSKVPDWFNHQNTGKSLVLDVPQLSNRCLKSFAVCAVYAMDQKVAATRTIPSVSIWINNIVSGSSFVYWPTIFGCLEKTDELIWISSWRPTGLVNEGDKFIVEVGTGYCYKVKEIGARLMYEDETSTQLDTQASCHNLLFNKKILDI